MTSQILNNDVTHTYKYTSERAVMVVEALMTQRGFSYIAYHGIGLMSDLGLPLATYAVGKFQ